MARKLHQAISDENHTYAVVETTAPSGGRKWGNFVNLSTVKVDNAMVDSLEDRRVIGNPNIEVIESWEVDAANRGPRSGYSKTLDALLEELPGHVQGDVRYNSDVLSPDGSTKEFAPVIADIQSQAAFGKSLDQVAQEALDQADKQGYAQISEGVSLHSQANIVSEQAQWAELDGAKGVDFTTAPYWLTDDSGAEPVPVSGADDEDLRQVFKENARVALEQEGQSASKAAISAPSNDDLASPEEVIAARQARRGRAM